MSDTPPDGVNSLDDRMEELITIMKGLSTSQKKLADSLLSPDFWMVVNGKNPNGKSNKSSYEKTFEQFTKAQQRAIKQLDATVDISKAMLAAYQKQLELSKKQNGIVDKFIAFKQREDIDKRFSDNAKEYSNTLRKYQDEHFKDALGDLFIKQSPFLQLLTKRSPNAPGSAYKRRMNDRSALNNEYDRRHRSINDDAYNEFILGRNGADDILAHRANIYTSGSDKENLYRDYTNDIGARKKKKSEQANNFKGTHQEAWKKSSSSPTASDLAKLPALTGSVGLYLGSKMDYASSLMEKLVGATDDAAQASLLENQKGLDEKLGQLLGGAGVSGALSKLLTTVIPGVLSAGAIAVLIGGIVTEIWKNRDRTEWGYKEGTIGGLDNGGTPSGQKNTEKESRDDRKLSIQKERLSAGATILTLEDLTSSQTALVRDKITSGALKLGGRFSDELSYEALNKIDPNLFPSYARGESTVGTPSKKTPLRHTGGLVPGKPGSETLIKALPGERVLSPAETTQYDAQKSAQASTPQISTAKLELLLVEVAKLQAELLNEMKQNTKVTAEKDIKIPEQKIPPVASRAFIKV